RPARTLDVRRYRDEQGGSHPRTRRLGIPRRPAPDPGPRGRRRGRRLGGRSGPPEVDRHLFHRAEGELRLQRLHHLLGPGPPIAAGPSPALVALVAPPRPRRAGPEDHAQPAPTRDPSGIVRGPPESLDEAGLTGPDRTSTRLRPRSFVTNGSWSLSPRVK